MKWSLIYLDVPLWYGCLRQKKIKLDSPVSSICIMFPLIYSISQDSIIYQTNVIATPKLQFHHNSSENPEKHIYIFVSECVTKLQNYRFFHTCQFHKSLLKIILLLVYYGNLYFTHVFSTISIVQLSASLPSTKLPGQTTGSRVNRTFYQGLY